MKKASFFEWCTLRKRMELFNEWDCEKNIGIDPYTVLYADIYSKRVWWKCSKGHSWEAMVKARVINDKCPCCTGRLVIPGENDFATLFPQFMKEWDFEKNAFLGLDPRKFKSTSGKKVWWKCEKGHSWQAIISNRRKQKGCPICAGTVLVPGDNDLATRYPDLLKEWDYEKNNALGLDPTRLLPKSNKRVHWKCEYGHEWSCTIANRTEGHGCKKCWLSIESSFPENAVFFYVKKICPDTIQLYHPQWLEGKELDVYIPSRKIAIEYDGERFHRKAQSRRDSEKNKQCKENGVRLIRIREPKCGNLNFEFECLQLKSLNHIDLEDAIRNLLALLGNTVSDTVNIRVDVDNDTPAIREQMGLYKKENSLAVLYPEVASEWNYERNGNVTPEHIMPFSNQLFWWRCKEL